MGKGNRVWNEGNAIVEKKEIKMNKLEFRKEDEGIWDGSVYFDGSGIRLGIRRHDESRMNVMKMRLKEKEEERGELKINQRNRKKGKLKTVYRSRMHCIGAVEADEEEQINEQ